ncbi:acyl-CoA dehydrogenase family protein [Paralcaligenes sp. KSB-10]|uniref:acyl-CoA dehydrogenase family protein n=1 Tax=Paralcaligenes sp. KSB-10 TaxID=2901142 RepID=UPI001E5C4D00|nr:acyl-CoA dehydrogenase family protein [Paralcaligenes sp. KSB-10]UHL62665.1 acyl-CoA dehydrogenase family protein [Paralcaligenes sp. KSB-10]
MSRLFQDHYNDALSQDEQQWLHRVRELCVDTIGPGAAETARNDTFAWNTFRLLADAGILATAFPRQYGGSDARQQLRIRLIEELGRVCSAAASMVTGADLSARAIVAGASGEVKQELIPSLCTGRIQAAFALTEPGAGSDVRGLQSVAVATNSGYVVSGRKKFITRASTSDWLVVVARCRRTATSGQKDEEPLVALLIPCNAPGVRIGPETGKLGWYGVPISEIELDQVSVAERWRLGAEGEGFSLAQDALVRARLGHASMALGRAIGAVEIAATYCNDREVFGKRLGSHQGVQWMLADMVTQIEASRALLANAAAAYDRGDPQSHIQASMAKLHATDLGMRVVTDALQLTGGRGYLQDFPLERFFRDAKLNQIGEGSSEVHKTVIGRDVVRRARESDRHPCLDANRLATDW